MKHSKEEEASFDPTIPQNVAMWRQRERSRLIQLRRELSLAARQVMDRAISEKLDVLLDKIQTSVFSIYWPIRGEPDLLPLTATLISRGGIVALPIVLGKTQSLQFRTWAPGEKLERGVGNIPVPLQGMEVMPSVVIVPLVGFDQAFFRLGYGGGFFDRTLPLLSSNPLVIGVGYELGHLVTIYPQPHDIPMDIIVTPEKVYRRNIGEG
ncbi:MAG: 5-formyltetrahydrofolate cyclo-ligase [Nitrospira sp.]|nr:5-formyltetrahydrofolate cyclo-ligase [Nitrospira sp.]